jgi:enoyl-CoA hydratase/carnithine racemase
MPETSIGLYPDVGASFFLNQLPPGLGMFLGISGCEWNGADAIAMGMANHLLDDSSKEQLPLLLANQQWAGDARHNHETLHHCLEQLPRAAIDPQLTPHATRIAACCHGTLGQAFATLPLLPISEAWFTQAMNNLTHGCHVTAHIVANQLQRGAGMSLADVFRMEWVLSVQCTRHADFPEGVRAQLVDKDKQPRWQFNTIAAVPQAYIDEHFLLPTGLVNPLGNLG